MADILRMIVVLSALCGLSGFALSYLKMVTAPVIEEQVLTYVQGPAIAGVFTGIDNQPIADRKAFETEKGRVLVFPAMRGGKLVGVALEAKGKGYGGDVGVMVGFNVPTTRWRASVPPPSRRRPAWACVSRSPASPGSSGASPRRWASRARGAASTASPAPPSLLQER